jgi:hypothetical protein
MFDSLTAFVLPGGAASLIGAASATIQIGGIYDLLGQGVGTAPANIIGTNRLNSFYGVDPGAGKGKPEIEITFGVSPVGAGTFAYALQYAPDTGVAGGYQPGTWETAYATSFSAATEYSTADAVRLDVAPSPPNTPQPRYVRVVMIPATGDHMTAGSVSFAGIVMARASDILTAQQTPSNYVAN